MITVPAAAAGQLRKKTGAAKFPGFPIKAANSDETVTYRNKPFFGQLLLYQYSKSIEPLFSLIMLSSSGSILSATIN